MGQPSHRLLKKKMLNQTTVTEFLLQGFSDVRELQVLHFVVFLVMYLAALMGNLLTISAVVLDDCLHTPMYFFLVNLSILDLGSISVTIPKSMVNSLLDTRSISYPACVAQVFLFVVFTSTDFALLTVMAYDRERVMNRRACVHMAAGAWIAGIVNSAVHTGNTFRLPFCQSNVLNQFFCEIPQLLKLACSDSYHSEVGLIAFRLDLVVGVLYAVVPPMINPVIYSMRNKELKSSLKKLFVGRLFSKN
nr:olfactory receptor 5B12-like [Pelodiscus sinensis]|eukprot:XP_014426025.1 olfactory receptor 5B12-like [Pelodiscus sinensis]